MKRLFVIVMIIFALFLASCEVKEGEVVTINKKDYNNIQVLPNESNYQLEVISQKDIVAKNKDIISKLKMNMMPIAVSPDKSVVFAFEAVNNADYEEENEKIITGNFKQEFVLYAVKAENGEIKKIGNFASLRDYKFDDSGRYFAFIDGNSNLYIYDLTTEKCDLLQRGNSSTSYQQVSWSKNSRSIMVNTTLNIDVASGELISYVVESPYIKSKLNDTDYIVQMLNANYDDMIAHYDFVTKDYISLANGVYLDSDNINIIYTDEDRNVLNIVNIKNRENEVIRNGPIYNAAILKSTGEVLFTTKNVNVNSQNRYLLYRYDPVYGLGIPTEVSSPTFYLSPAEDKLYFINNFTENNFTIALPSLASDYKEVKKESEDISQIRKVVLKMLDLDYNFKDGYDKYSELAKDIYVNTYDPIPQEALENKLIDFKRFNMPIPTNQKSIIVPDSLAFKTLNIEDNKASANIAMFYVNSLEFVKIDEKWYIAGFSTHPNSKEIEAVKSIVQSYLDNIINANHDEAIKYLENNEDTEFVNSQLKIINDLIDNRSKQTISIGEIELWNKNDPHRVDVPETATDARVKIVINNNGDILKYKLVLSRAQRDNFEIVNWSSDPLSISQLF